MRTIRFVASLMLIGLLMSTAQAQVCKDGKYPLQRVAEVIAPRMTQANQATYVESVPVYPTPVVYSEPVAAVMQEPVCAPIPERKVIQYIRYSKPVKTTTYRVAKLFRCHR